MIEIPQKTHERATICHLDPPEIKALLAAPDRSTWLGRRDHALLLTAIQTGLRVSELCGVRIGHVRLETGASIQVLGKRRKQRVTPLTPGTVKVLRVWLRERQGEDDDPLFPTRQGGPLSPKAIAWLLDKHTATATRRCPALNKKRVTPHVLRHYVDGWVMWPPGVFPLLKGGVGPGRGHITPGVWSTSCLVDVSDRVRAYVRTDLAHSRVGVCR